MINVHQYKFIAFCFLLLSNTGFLCVTAMVANDFGGYEMEQINVAQPNTRFLPPTLDHHFTSSLSSQWLTLSLSALEKLLSQTLTSHLNHQWLIWLILLPFNTSLLKHSPQEPCPSTLYSAVTFKSVIHINFPGITITHLHCLHIARQNKTPFLKHCTLDSGPTYLSNRMYQLSV